MAKQRFRLMRDDSAHWYAVPVEHAERFSQLADGLESEDEDAAYEAADEMEAEFARYRLTMHPSNYTFTDLKEV